MRLPYRLLLKKFHWNQYLWEKDNPFWFSFGIVSQGRSYLNSLIVTFGNPEFLISFIHNFDNEFGCFIEFTDTNWWDLSFVNRGYFWFGARIEDRWYFIESICKLIYNLIFGLLIKCSNKWFIAILESRKTFLRWTGLTEED